MYSDCTQSPQRVSRSVSSSTSCTSLLTDTIFLITNTATTDIYTLSLHDALPICTSTSAGEKFSSSAQRGISACIWLANLVDRKSTRLNSSHSSISYAVFCLKKKNKTRHQEA